MVLMPDSPAVSFAQLSVLPAPSEVTTPRPVTTTIGRPNLSLPCCHRSLLLSRCVRPTQDLRLASGRHRSPTTWSNFPVIGRSSPDGSQGGNRLPWPSATVASAMFMANCGSIPWPRYEPVARTARSGCASKNARSSAVAGLAPVAPDNTATWPVFICPFRRSQRPESVSVTCRACRFARSETTAERRPKGFCAALFCVIARLDDEECAKRAQRETAIVGRAPIQVRICSSASARQIHRASTNRAARHCASRRPVRCRFDPRQCAKAQYARHRSRQTSSPMNVREEPVTPCTIEILPASKLESCARNRVGRRSLISRSFRNAAGFGACAMPLRMVESTVRSRSPPPAATIMSICERISVLPLTPGGIERETGGIGADALPVLHLALIAFFRDLRVEIDRRQRMDDKGRESRRVGDRLCFRQFLPMRVGPFAETGDNSNAGDPDFPRALSHRRRHGREADSAQRSPASVASFRRWGNRARVA